MIYKCFCGKAHDNGIDRRHFLGLSAGAVFGYALTKFAHPVEVVASSGFRTQNKAEFLVIINMNGGPSHSDLFDAKSNDLSSYRIRPDSWEQRMDIQQVAGDSDNPFYLPMGLLGELAPHADKMIAVRTRQWSDAHEIGQYLVYTGYDRNPAFQPERPHLGAAIAAEFARNGRRRPDDVLPGFVSLNGLPYQNGFLSGQFAPFVVSASRNGLNGLNTHPEGEPRFNTRYDLLQTLDADNRSANPPLGKPAADMRDFYTATKSLMYNQRVNDAFKVQPEDQPRYSPIGDPNGNGFGNACIVARNLLKANLGTRVINIGIGGWDQHGNIYNGLFGSNPASPNGNGRQLSAGLGALITDLKAEPSVRGDGGTLLDDTLIICLGDFGRTPAYNYRQGGTGLNNGQGRDHYSKVCFFTFIGGRIKGGRVIGKTDETGADHLDPGWDAFDQQNRRFGQLRPRNVGGYPNAGPLARVEDGFFTVYSALGIDPTYKYVGTPSGRPFELIYKGADYFGELPLWD